MPISVSVPKEKKEIAKKLHAFWDPVNYTWKINLARDKPKKLPASVFCQRTTYYQSKEEFYKQFYLQVEQERKNLRDAKRKALVQYEEEKRKHEEYEEFVGMAWKD